MTRGADALPAAGVVVTGPPSPSLGRVLTPDALAFVAHLQRAFGPRRERLLAARRDRQAALDVGVRPGLRPETAASEMDEILWALRDHAVGLNAGRWDYLFSIIKKFRRWPSLEMPDRAQVTMTVPFMRAYTERLVRTCHRRAAHAIGGMAAFIPAPGQGSRLADAASLLDGLVLADELAEFLTLGAYPLLD